MSRPWDRESRYRFILAAFAAELARQAGEAIALFGSPVRITGSIMRSEAIEEAMILRRVVSPAEVEDQITVIANVIGDDEVAERLASVMGKTFNLAERSRPSVPRGARDCIWMIGILPPFAPAGWPKEYPDKAGWPTTFTLEIVAWPEGTDLGQLPAGI